MKSGKTKGQLNTMTLNDGVPHGRFLINGVAAAMEKLISDPSFCSAGRKQKIGWPASQRYTLHPDILQSRFRSHPL